MTQERLTDLAQVSIENDLCSLLNFDKIITSFSRANWFIVKVPGALLQ
jgi:hypothetical protein